MGPEYHEFLPKIVYSSLIIAVELPFIAMLKQLSQRDPNATAVVVFVSLFFIGMAIGYGIVATKAWKNPGNRTWEVLEGLLFWLNSVIAIGCLGYYIYLWFSGQGA